jgi:4-amino-4-deoxy-L-arabinose transferase-like glycosyltransferase
MDLSWLVWFLVIVVVLSIAYWIIKALIMPVVPAPAQAMVWAIIGICLLIALIIFIGQGSGYWHHGLSTHP